MSQVPRLSIGIPVYDGENYLAELLDCLLKQTFRDFEIVISDNASTDRTAEICSDYANRDGRIRYVRNERNIGAARNFNRVFELARAPYFKWTAHDDFYHPTYLERCLEAIEQDPEVVLCHSGVYFIADDGSPLRFDVERLCFVDNQGGTLEVSSLESALEALEPIHLAEGRTAVSRFCDVVDRRTWCTHIFGIVRRDVLSSTALHESYFGSDKVLLAELALSGRFFQVEDKLFAKRCHTGMTMYLSPQERAQWIDPDAQRVSTPVGMFMGYIRAVLRTRSLSLSHRIVCLAAIIRKTMRSEQWGRMFRRGRQAVLRTLFERTGDKICNGK
jgi:glycosyltransferase involved in cell wall biosynthesis